MRSRHSLYTIGYEGISIQDFVDILVNHGIKILVDVRELPLSRKQGFSKTKLSDKLQETGVDYYHARPLGAPKSIRNALRVNGDWKAYKESYVDVLNNQADELSAVAHIAQERRTVLMCFEHNYQECHRSLIVEKLVQNGFVEANNVRHLRAPKKEMSANHVVDR